MANEFVKIDPHKLKDNIFKLIDLDWMLVTAGPRRGPTSGSSAIGLRRFSCVTNRLLCHRNLRAVSCKP